MKACSLVSKFMALWCLEIYFLDWISSPNLPDSIVLHLMKLIILSFNISHRFNLCCWILIEIQSMRLNKLCVCVWTTSKLHISIYTRSAFSLPSTCYMHNLNDRLIMLWLKIYSNITNNLQFTRLHIVNDFLITLADVYYVAWASVEASSLLKTTSTLTINWK